MIYYFFDSKLVREKRNTTIKVNNPVKEENNPLFQEGFWERAQKPWEVRYDNGYPCVFYDPYIERYRCYYTLFIRDEESENVSLQERVTRDYIPTKGRITALCYAESKDGINFYKPNLGRVSFNGTKDNNIVMIKSHGGYVFLDHREQDPRKRYKLITRDDHSGFKELIYSYCDDGFSFDKKIKLRGIPDFVEGDTFNFVTFDENINGYILMNRVFFDEKRMMVALSSQDLINWEYKGVVLQGQGVEDQIYSMPIFHQEQLKFGFASVFHKGNTDDRDYDLVDLELTYSRNGFIWERIERNAPFIPRGEGSYPNGAYDCGCIYCSSPPIEDGEDYIIYYMGGNGPHTNYRETTLNRCRIDRRKLAYMENKNGEARILLNRLFVDDYPFFINCDVEGGYVKVRVTDGKQPMEGYDFDDFDTITTSGKTRLIWKGKDYDKLYDHVMFEIIFEKARLYYIEGETEVRTFHKY